MEYSPKIKGRIHIDEKYIPILLDFAFDLNAIDHKTKYIISHSLVDKRTKPKVINFYKKIKITCYKQILERYKKNKKNKIIFVSDGFQNYKNAFNKLFFRVAELQFGVPIACKRYGYEHNNNPIERYNEDIEDRIKTMRNFGSFEGAENFLNLKTIIHNFINPHMQLQGKTPAEEAEIDLKLGRQKLLNLIKLQAKMKYHSLR